MSDNRERPGVPGPDAAQAARRPRRCPVNGPHADADLPAAIRALPRCPVKGAPIPFSSGTNAEGAGRFGINDHLAVMFCVIGGLCGICGTKLDGEAAFLVRDTRPIDLAALSFADPPNHEACALWATRLCPRIAASDASGRGWLIIACESWSPGPPPDGSKGLVGFAPGPVKRIRVLAYDGGKLAEREVIS